MPISDPARRAMVSAMVAAMASDGDLDAAEQDVIRNTFAELAGVPLDEATFAADLDRAVTDPEGLYRTLGESGADLPAPDKEAIVRGVVRVVMADGELADGELVALNRVARALSFAELRRVMNSVWRESRAAG
jgi:uncharacterized tellurite resistance protein B-like protein